MQRDAIGTRLPRRRPLLLGAGAALVLVGIGALWFWNASRVATTRSRVFWLVPEDFRGWVQVRFGAQPSSDCPPLLVSDHNFVIHVPPTGELCTSTPLTALPKSPHIFMRIPTGLGGTGELRRSFDPPEWVTSLTTGESVIRFFVTTPDETGRTRTTPSSTPR
jgi:hypothetical protein